MCTINFGYFFEVIIGVIINRKSNFIAIIGPNDVLVVPSTTITKMDRWVDQYIAKLLMFRGTGASIGYRLEDV